MENFFKRLESYTEVRPTTAMTDIIMKIMIEVLSVLAIATKEIEQRRTSEFIPREFSLLTRCAFRNIFEEVIGKERC